MLTPHSRVERGASQLRRQLRELAAESKARGAAVRLFRSQHPPRELGVG
jgi:hypothetical protein